jgi:hypothetical protein
LISKEEKKERKDLLPNAWTKPFLKSKSKYFSL